jgi:hypothetical protein
LLISKEYVEACVLDTFSLPFAKLDSGHFSLDPRLSPVREASVSLLSLPANQRIAFQNHIASIAGDTIRVRELRQQNLVSGALNRSILKLADVPPTYLNGPARVPSGFMARTKHLYPPQLKEHLCKTLTRTAWLCQLIWLSFRPTRLRR